MLGKLSGLTVREDPEECWRPVYCTATRLNWVPACTVPARSHGIGSIQDRESHPHLCHRCQCDDAGELYDSLRRAGFRHAHKLVLRRAKVRQDHPAYEAQDMHHRDT